MKLENKKWYRLKNCNRYQGFKKFKFLFNGDIKSPQKGFCEKGVWGTDLLIYEDMVDSYVRCSSNEIRMCLNEERIKRNLIFGTKYKSMNYDNVVEIDSDRTWYFEDSDRFDVGRCNLYENGIWVEKI